MADLLTHVLVAYVIGSLLAWRYEWFSSALVTVVMAGALLPDFRKIYLVIPGDTIAQMLEIPFSWAPLHNVGGILVVISIAVVLVPHAMRVPVLLALCLGSFEHLLFDSFLYWPDGISSGMYWPIANVGFAVDGFYKSWDMVPLAITLGLVGVVLAGTWYRQSRRTNQGTRSTTNTDSGDASPEWPPEPVLTTEGYDRGIETGD